MSRPLCFKPRATFLLRLVLLLATLIPGPAKALQLRWSTGVTDLSVTTNTRVELVVQADSAEATIPGRWKLMWTADSTGISFAALDSAVACETDTARVASITPPTTSADSSANEITAQFCSAGSAVAATAYFLVDLVGGSKGKLKVVALDPNDPDSTTVLESNEVTYNAGIDGDYLPLVLRASSVHQSLQLRVTAVGSGLSAASSLSIAGTDASWSLPLTIAARSESTITGVASVAALLPACRATVGSTSGGGSGALLPADQEPAPYGTESGGCSAQYVEGLLQPPPYNHGYTIQPKDFAFTAGFVDTATNRYALHVFYIRHNYWHDEFYDRNGVHYLPHPELNEKNIGHAWTSALDPWQDTPIDTAAIVVRANKFDELHVWAPTIVRLGATFHMFYTGVKADQSGKEHQRIGVATSTDLNTWTQSNSVVLSAPDVPWVSKNPKWAPYRGAQQFRDPYVMEDPAHAGQWLMYFVALDSLNASPDTTVQLRLAVGVARSTDLIHWTALPKPFCSTERPTIPSVSTSAQIIESPHVFRRNGRWWMPYTVDQDTVFFETSASADPADTVAAHWNGPIGLQSVSQEHPAPLQYWHATEHLGSGANEYLAAFNDNASSIDVMGVFAPDNPSLDSLKLGCPTNPPPAGVGDGSGARRELRLVVTRVQWGAGDVGLRLELPSRMPVRLAVYDVAGRRRATLLDREMPAGVTNLKWNGSADAGSRVASGMYFIRLTCAKGARASKVVMLR